MSRMIDVTAAARRLLEARHILILTHRRPDGDTWVLPPPFAGPCGRRARTPGSLPTRISPPGWAFCWRV